jgi:transcriptional regulator with PAS, ATPase and Fis domain
MRGLNIPEETQSSILNYSWSGNVRGHKNPMGRLIQANKEIFLKPEYLKELE